MRKPLPLTVTSALLVFTSLLLAIGCTSDNDDTPTPTATPTATATAEPTTPVTDSPTATATPEATPEATATATAAPEPDLNPEPATIDAATIEGYSEVTDAREGEPWNYDVAYPAVAGLDGFNAAVAAEVQRQLDQFGDQIGTPTPLPDGRIPQELTLTSEFLVASGDVIGVRLNTFRFFGANGADTSTTVWYDLALGQQLPAAALLEGADGLAELHDLVTARIAATRPDDPIDLAATPPTEALYHSLGFTLDGALVVTFDEAAVGPAFLGPVAVAIPRPEVEPLLSDFGRRALTETRNPSGPLITVTG